MALGEEKAEGEASADTKAPCERWSRREQELDPSRLVLRQQPPRLEAEGGPASPAGGAEGLPAPACCGGAGPGPSGAYQPQASGASREPVVGGSQPALGYLLLPAGLGAGDLCSLGSQVSTKSGL